MKNKKFDYPRGQKIIDNMKCETIYEKIVKDGDAKIVKMMLHMILGTQKGNGKCLCKIDKKILELLEKETE